MFVTFVYQNLQIQYYASLLAAALCGSRKVERRRTIAPVLAQVVFVGDNCRIHDKEVLTAICQSTS
jgi:hypothetical protein